MCQDWAHQDGWSDSSWGSHEGLPGRGDGGIASLERDENGGKWWSWQKAHGGLQFGAQTPPCHEMLIESLFL